MGTKVTLELDPIQKMLVTQGLEEGGLIQKKLTNEIWKHSEPFTPFRTGNLAHNVIMARDGTWFQYLSPYARYHWYGKLMIGPAPKKETDIDLTYQGAPMRGPFWVIRMWNDKKDEILKNIWKGKRG